jgi:mannose-1-phosphate guanylyltransferase
MAQVYAVIMAGGRGERFWPLSTDEVPKPFLPLLGSSTLLQETVARLQPLIPIERIMVSVGEMHSRIAKMQLPQIPESNFVVEPVGRDTSACLGFCALHLERRDPEAVMFALPADHFISEPHAFRLAAEKGINSLEGAEAVIFGIVPTRPDTGYGYIMAEKPALATDAWPVLRFFEKPDAERAAAYCRAGNFFWNSGMFLWRNRTLLELFRKHMPETWEGLSRLRPLLGSDEDRGELARIYSALKRISIDYGILEKTSGMRLVPAAFPWDDIGNWASLGRALPSDGAGNVSRGSFAGLEAGGCITYSDAGTVALFGVTDMVVVQAHGKVLVCPRNRAPDLKKLMASLPGSDRKSV